MSHIPNAAMPHAGPQTDNEPAQGDTTTTSRLSEIRSGVAEMVREHPKTAMAAGAAVAAGIVAAAAIPAIRARGRTETKSGGKSKS